jgi:hypothetical protein
LENSHPQVREDGKPFPQVKLPGGSLETNSAELPSAPLSHAEMGAWKQQTSPDLQDNGPSRQTLSNSYTRPTPAKFGLATSREHYSTVSAAKVSGTPDRYGGLYCPDKSGPALAKTPTTLASKYTKSPPLDQKSSQTKSINPKSFNGQGKARLLPNLHTAKLMNDTVLHVPQRDPPSIQHGLDRVLFKYEFPRRVCRIMLIERLAQVYFIYETQGLEFIISPLILKRYYRLMSLISAH